MGSTDPAVVVGYTLLCLGVGALIVSVPVWMPVVWDAMERGVDRLAGFLGGLFGRFGPGGSTKDPALGLPNLEVVIVESMKNWVTVEIRGPKIPHSLAHELARYATAQHTHVPYIFLVVTDTVHWDGGSRVRVATGPNSDN